MEELTIQEISERFKTKSETEAQSLEPEIDKLRRKLLLLEKLRDDLYKKASIEQDKVANQLDKDCPNWRKIIVRNLIDNNPE